jgi:signal peptidase II
MFKYTNLLRTEILYPIIFFIADRILKVIALQEVIMSNFLFDFTLVLNTGMTWGLFKDNNTILLFLSIIIVGLIIYFYDSFSKVKLGINLILVGAFSNIIDRIFFGYVVDFVDFRFFPVFNIADACITLGAIYIIIYFLFLERLDDKKVDKKTLKKRKSLQNIYK